MVRLGPIDLPYLGGTYLRLLPAAVRRIGLRRAARDEAFHPHDPIGTLASRIAWLGRSLMGRQLGRLLATGGRDEQEEEGRQQEDDHGQPPPEVGTTDPWPGGGIVDIAAREHGDRGYRCAADPSGGPR